MENFIFGLQNIGVNLVSLFGYLLANQLFWGFCIGFGVSTILHIVIVSGGVQNATRVLVSSAENSYPKVIPSDTSHPDYKTFEQFLRVHSRARSIALVGLIAFVMVILYLVAK